MHDKCGQAMIEFAICLLAFALVLSALLAFGSIVPKSMALQSESRRAAGCAAQVGGGSPEGSLSPRHLDNLPSGVRSVAVVEIVSEERHETVDLDALSAEYLFETNGENEFRIHERTSMPSMRIPNFETDYQMRGDGE